MREPTGATPATGIPEPAAARPASSAISGDDAPAGDAAARMEQVIDAFIWRDCDERPEAFAFISSTAAHATSVDGLTDIVARLAPRPLAGTERLPRIVTSSLPINPPGRVHDDQWRRQALDARHDLVNETSRFAAGWRTGRHVLVAAVVMSCVFSTGVLWATHRSEIVAETSGQPAETAAAIPEPAAVGDATPGQSIRNTPVLIREGESILLTSILARTINDGEPPRAISVAPVAPIAPVVRVVPVVPIAAAPQMEDAVTPGDSIADAVAPSPPLQPAGPKLDREGLSALAARSAAPPANHGGSVHHGPATPEHRVAAVPAGRVSSVPFSERGPVPELDRREVPAGWVQRRQSLRVEPVEEPSTLKKLIGLVWPPGNSSTTAEPSKPAAAPAVTAPAVTAPAVTAPAYSWSDSSRASP